MAGSQSIECGTPDITLAQRDSFLQQLSSNTIAAAAANSPWKMGIWFYHLRYSDGSTSQTDYNPQHFIDSVNQYFDGLFEFKICGTTDIDDDKFTILNLDPASKELEDLWSEVDTLNEPLANNCIRVFLCGGGAITSGSSVYGGYCLSPLDNGAKSAVFLALLEPRT